LNPSGKRGPAAFVAAVIGLAQFLVVTNITLVIPLLGLMRRDLDLSASEAGVVLGAFPTVAFVANLALGPFLDRFGRRRFLLLGSLGCALTFVLTAAASSSWLVSLGRAATGIFMPMIGASVFATVADYFPPPERTRITGYVSAAASLAQLLAIPFTLLLGDALTWRAPLVALAVYSLALGGLVAALPPPRFQALATGPVTAQTYRRRLLSFSASRETRLALTAYFIYSAAVFVYLGLYPTWLLTNTGIGSARTVAEIFFLGGCGGVVGAVLSGHVARRFRRPMLLCSVLATASALIMLAVPTAPTSFTAQIVSYGVFSFGRAMLLPVFVAATMLLVAAHERGSLNGMINAIFQSASAVGAFISGWLYHLVPSFAANGAVAMLLFLGAAIALAGVARSQAPAAPAPTALRC